MLLGVKIAKNCLFGAVKLIRSGGKSKFTNNGWGIAFDKKGFWCFDNDTARNVVIGGVYYSSLSHIDKPKSYQTF